MLQPMEDDCVLCIFQVFLPTFEVRNTLIRLPVLLLAPHPTPREGNLAGLQGCRKLSSCFVPVILWVCRVLTWERWELQGNH